MRFFEFVDNDKLNLDAPKTNNVADTAIKKAQAIAGMQAGRPEATKSAVKDDDSSDDDYSEMTYDGFTILRPLNSATMLKLAQGTNWSTENMQDDRSAAQFTVFLHASRGKFLLDPYTGNLINAQSDEVSQNDLLGHHIVRHMVRRLRSSSSDVGYNKSIFKVDRGELYQVLRILIDDLKHFVLRYVESESERSAIFKIFDELSDVTDGVYGANFIKWAHQYAEDTNTDTQYPSIRDVDEIIGYILSKSKISPDYRDFIDAISHDWGVIPKMTKPLKNAYVVGNTSNYTIIRLKRSKMIYRDGAR